MADYGDTNAWIRLTYGSDALYINCEKWSYDIDDTQHIGTDYPNFGHTGYTPNTYKIVFKLQKVWVKTESDWNVLKAQLKAAMSTSCTLRIQISSDPTYELEWGAAGKDEHPVIITNLKGLTKNYNGDAERFEIPQLIFRKIGAAT